MTARDAKRLVGCDARLIVKLDRVLAEMAALDAPMMITSGVRTAAEQAALFAQGRTFVNGRWRITGRVVTYANGLDKPSNHQSGRAADCAFLVNGQPSWDETLPWQLYADTAIAEGLQAGYYWKKQDKPHVELAPESEGVLKA